MTALCAAPDGWSDACRASGALFHSEAWQALLERGFGCRTLYLWDSDARDGAAISLFRAGPFRVGYLGFPFGATLAMKRSPQPLLEHPLRAAGVPAPTALRIPVSAFAPVDVTGLPFVATPETAIEDLPSWRLDNLSANMRRDVNQAQRSRLKLHDANSAAQGSAMYALYARTIERNRGAERYTEAYFRGLVELAARSSAIRILVASLDDDIAAFTAIVRHGTMACYLHGATDRDLRRHQPAALLLDEGIRWAQSEGCNCFNLMSSPPEQPSLVRYKERWGAVTREHRTFTMATGATYPLFRLAERIYRMTGH